MIFRLIQKSHLFLYLSFVVLLPAHGFSDHEDEVDYYIYVSPGFNLGYTFGEGFTRGFQITAGVVSVTSGEIFPEPHWSAGVSYAYRTSAHRDIQYLDFQISPLGLFGFGIGRAKVFTDYDLTPKYYTHSKLWGGLYGLIQYDRFSSLDENFNYLGFTGVFPLGSDYLSF